jgi:hypothetical protein
MPINATKKTERICGKIAAQETITNEFRSGPATGRKKFQKGRARAGCSEGDDGL